MNQEQKSSQTIQEEIVAQNFTTQNTQLLQTEKITEISQIYSTNQQSLSQHQTQPFNYSESTSSQVPTDILQQKHQQNSSSQPIVEEPPEKQNITGDKQENVTLQKQTSPENINQQINQNEIKQANNNDFIKAEQQIDLKISQENVECEIDQLNVEEKQQVFQRFQQFNKNYNIEKEILKEESIPHSQNIIQSPEGAYSRISKIEEYPYNQRLFLLTRINYLRHLTLMLSLIGEKGKQLFPYIFKFVVRQTDQARIVLLSQIPSLIEYIQRYDNAYQSIKNQIVPLLFNLLYCSNLDVKEKAGDHLSVVAHKLTDKDRGQQILKQVLNMAHNQYNQQNRIVAVQLLSKMAPIFGTELCQVFICIELLSLGEDISNRVRKQAIINLHNFGSSVSRNYFNIRLLNFYLSKVQDKNWGIRKACADEIVEISKLCDKLTKQKVLSQIMINFLKDVNKWVKIAAYNNLGPFIVTLEGSQINEKLFQFFRKMPSINDVSSDNQVSSDYQIIVSCAYNFPAVLYIYGKQRWQKLSQIYFRLVKSNDRRVKKTLACSIHQIAKIIGPKQTQKDLFPILQIFIKDLSDQVKFGVIQHLSEFLMVFESEKRENLLDVFLFLQKDPKKWRIRQLISDQIDSLCKIYDSNEIYKFILPISIKLCNDNVAIVRLKAAKKIYALVQALQKNEEYLRIVIENIKGFALSNKYYQRQSQQKLTRFLYMCSGLLKKQIFKNELLEDFRKVTIEKVGVVRLLAANILKQEYTGQQSYLDDLILQLRQDKQYDIRELAKQIGN